MYANYYIRRQDNWAALLYISVTDRTYQPNKMAAVGPR